MWLEGAIIIKRRQYKALDPMGVFALPIELTEERRAKK